MNKAKIREANKDYIRSSKIMFKMFVDVFGERESERNSKSSKNQVD